jgi:hypothetical protein
VLKDEETIEQLQIKNGEAIDLIIVKKKAGKIMVS